MMKIIAIQRLWIRRRRRDIKKKGIKVKERVICIDEVGKKQRNNNDEYSL